MPRSPVEQLARALQDTGALVSAVQEDQWEKPTPCAEWSVSELVEHLTLGNHLFARALLGESLPAALAPSGPPSAAYRESADALLTAFRTPDALEREITVPFGAVPGIVALHLRLVESLVHGWDLARATEQALRCDEELAAQELEFTRAKLADVPPERSPFGPPQPIADDAPALDRLAAYLGRPVTTVSLRRGCQ